MVANKRAKGDGTIYQRESDGLWRATLELPARDGQKRRRKYLSAKTEAQVKEKLKLAKRELLKHGDLPTGSMTLATWADVWFRDIALKRIRPRTAAGYRSQIEQYIKPAIGKVRLDKLTPAHVRRLHDFITIEKELSSTTASQSHRILSVMLRDAERDNLVTINAAKRTDAPRKASNDLNVLTPADAVKALQASRGDRLWSLQAARLFIGARQGELLGLELDRITDSKLQLSWQLQRISWEHGCNDKCGETTGSRCPERKITKPAGWDHRYLEGGFWLTRPKTDAGMRVIPLPAILRPVFEERIIMAQSEPNPHGLLWTADRKKSKGGSHELLPLDGSPIDPSRDNKAWHEFLHKADVTDVRLHDARHTTASLLLAFGSSPTVVTKILGHSTYAMSQKYMNVDDHLLLEAMDGIAGLLPFETKAIDK